MKKTYFKVKIGFTILALAFGSQVLAQSGMSNARSVAMGGAYLAIARGVEAPRWNPANLGLSGERNFNLNLISFGVGFHNNSFSKKQYDLYNGSYLTEQDKQDILSTIPAQGLRVDFDTEVQAMGLSFGQFAFTVTGFASSDFTLSKDLVDLFLNGNELDRVYSINSTAGEGWGMSSFGLSAGFPVAISVPFVSEFSVGGTFKYLRSFGYGKVREANTSFVTGIDGLIGSGRVEIDYAKGGSGVGVDLGAAAVVMHDWHVGLTVRNILNYINWNSEPERFIYAFEIDSLNVKRVEDSDIDSVFVDSDETVAIDPFTTSLPQELRIGVARNMGSILFAVDVVQGLKRSAGVSTTPKLAVGSEWRPVRFLPLRAGFSMGGKNVYSFSAGFGFDASVFALDFAVRSRDGFVSGKGIGAAFNWMFRF